MSYSWPLTLTFLEKAENIYNFNNTDYSLNKVSVQTILFSMVGLYASTKWFSQYWIVNEDFPVVQINTIEILQRKNVSNFCRLTHASKTHHSDSSAFRRHIEGISNISGNYYPLKIRTYFTSCPVLKPEENLLVKVVVVFWMTGL